MLVQVRRREALIFPNHLSGLVLHFTSVTPSTRDFLWCSSLPRQWVPAGSSSRGCVLIWPTTCVHLAHRVHYSATKFENNLFWGNKMSLDSQVSTFRPLSLQKECQRKVAVSLQQPLPAKESSCNAPGPSSCYSLSQLALHSGLFLLFGSLHCLKSRCWDKHLGSCWCLG